MLTTLKKLIIHKWESNILKLDRRLVSYFRRAFKTPRRDRTHKTHILCNLQVEP